jgi:hypothetical protein
MALLPTKLSVKSEIVRRRRVEIYNLPTEEQANEFAAVLLASYPAGGKADDGANKVYFRQLRELLRGYPHCVLDQLINPRTGVPGMVEGFPFPSIASVKAIADGFVGRRADELKRLEEELKDEQERHEESIFQSRLSPEARAEQADRAHRLAELMRKNAKALMMDFPHLGPQAFGISPEEHARMRQEAIDNLTEINGGKGVK